MSVRVASLLEIKNVLLVGMNLRLVEEADPLHLGVVLDIILYSIIQRLMSMMMMTSQTPHSCKLTFFSSPDPFFNLQTNFNTRYLHIHYCMHRD